MYTKKSVDKELAAHGVKLDRKQPDDRKVQIDQKRAAPSHDSNLGNAKPNAKPSKGK